MAAAAVVEDGEFTLFMKIDQVKVGNRQCAVGKKWSSYHVLLTAYCLLFFSTHLAFAQKAVPELWGARVHDEAHALKQESVDQLEKELKAYEDSTSNQIAILVVQSLDGDVLEEYSLRVAEKWKLGTKNKDNGVLLFIAVDDHKMRIEVGQGLEGVLTDAQSNRIIRNEIAPEFRRNDYDAGVKAGIHGIVKAIAGEYKADDDNGGMSSENIILLVGFILVFLFIIGYAFYKEIKSPSNGKSSSGRRSGSSGVGGSSSSGWSSSSGSSFSGGGGSFGGGGSSGGW